MSVYFKSSPAFLSGSTHSRPAEILQNIMVGLAFSFVALSLGAALGMLSGRGAFAGMISAGLLAFIVSCLGGTRVQCTGPTAITVWFNLNIAVVGFTALFYLHNKVFNSKNPMHDLKSELETDGFAKQN